MLGRILYNDNIHLARFENNILEVYYSILLEKTSEFENAFFNDFTKKLSLCILENNEYIFFDLTHLKKENIIFPLSIYKYQIDTYFRKHSQLDFNQFLCEKSNLSFKTIVFENGILKPMYAFIDDQFNFNTTIKLNNGLALNASVKFVVVDNEEYEELKNDKSTLLLSDKNIIKKYQLIVEFEKNVDFDYLNETIDFIKKFLAFYNLDNYFPIEKIIVDFGFKLDYISNSFNYDCSIIRRFSFLKNFNVENVKKLFEEIQNKKYDLSFLNVFNKKCVNYEEVYDLAKSIDTCIVNREIDKNNQFTDAEDLARDELKEKIEEVFKNINYNFDNDFKDFLLSMAKSDNFRKKITIILNKFNSYNIVSNQFSTFSKEDIEKYAKLFQNLRNNIHGVSQKDISCDDRNVITKNVAFAFYIYILLEIFQFDKKTNSPIRSSIFNLLSNFNY